jgi:hypothetical protein
MAHNENFINEIQLDLLRLNLEGQKQVSTLIKALLTQGLNSNTQTKPIKLGGIWSGKIAIDDIEKDIKENRKEAQKKLEEKF